jgi:hypothetical protein
MNPRALLPGLLLLPALVQAAPRTQAPDAAWLTFTTAHYRIHCPAAFEGFGREVAGRVEGIHAQYLGLVGFVYEKPIDILILDPVMEANGMALPVFQRPHVVLWKTAPEADSVIGHHRGWAELVVAHELGHMHHLLRPQRKPNLWQRWTAVIGPLPEKAPRWVTEGYATLIEGKLTGSGRPHSAVRAAILRQWSLEGKLPSYEALSGTGGFLGGSMAYLGGSAYLEWLETKAADPKVFQALWTRLAGKRKFDDAFLATFGFGPKDGYQRFCAELTHTALELERRVKAQGLREGELFTQLKGEVTGLALSPDGAKLLARVLDPKQPGLYVWDLKAPVAKKVKPKDPDEPADHAPAAPVVAPNQRLGRIHGALPWKPVWTSANTVAFQLRLADGEGVLQPQPWQWQPGTAPRPAAAPPKATGGIVTWKEVDGIWNLVDAAGKPLTRNLAAAWNPTTTPDGKWIYYTQLSATGLQIRRLDTSLPPLEAKALPVDPEPLVRNVALPKADEPSPLPPPVDVASHPYRIGESHDLFSLVGISSSPAGVNTQLGLGGNDILGRLNWQVLAGLGLGNVAGMNLGNLAGPRGAMAGASWHGWRWAPSLQLFSSLERPSNQDFLSVQGFDRERQGFELAFEREDLGRPRHTLRPYAAAERVTPRGGTSLSRSLVGVDAGLGSHWSRNDQGLQLGLAVREQQGRTEGQAWQLTRITFRAGWINPWVPLAVLAEGGRLGGQPTALDQFHLGGVPTSLLPTSLDANRVVQAALPAYTATGNRLQRLRGELGGPVQLYLEHSTIWQDSSPKPTAQRVAGLELDSRRLGLPQETLRRLMGNLSFTLGVHRPLDGIMKGRTVGTISLLLRP